MIRILLLLLLLKLLLLLLIKIQRMHLELIYDKLAFIFNCEGLFHSTDWGYLRAVEK